MRLDIGRRAQNLMHNMLNAAIEEIIEDGKLQAGVKETVTPEFSKIPLDSAEIVLTVTILPKQGERMLREEDFNHGTD